MKNLLSYQERSPLDLSVGVSQECSLCGLCKANCPVYKVLLKETVSPRGFAILKKKGLLDKIFYACSLCKACKIKCPIDLDLEINEIREKLVKNKMETEANKKMIKNIREYGNPFGRVKRGKVVKELYCC